MSVDNATRLASLLDKIDQVKAGVAESGPSSQTNSTNNEASQSESITFVKPDQPNESVGEDIKARPFYGWYEFIDGKSCKSYYHNYSTGQTQWEKPDASDIVKAPPPAPLSRPTDEVPVERAYFGKSGNFSHSGSQSYWAKMGREEDKAGRQLGIFMDLSTLEKNREEAKRMKEEAQRRSGTRGDVDWSTYKNQKQTAKKRKAQSWLYED